MNSPHNFNGHLKDFSLADVLRLLHDGHMTGVLKLDYEDERLNSRISFLRGRLGRVISPFATKLRVLLESLEAPSHQLDTNDISFSDRKRQQLQLHDINTLDLTGQAMRLRAEMALMPLFHQTAGRFSFTLSEAPAAFGNSGLNAHTLSLDLARRLDEVMHIGAYTLRPFDHFGLVGHIDEFIERTRDLKHYEWLALSIFESPKSLQSAGVELCLPWDELLKLILKLERLGLLQVLPLKKGRLESGDLLPMFSLPATPHGLFTSGKIRAKTTLLTFLCHKDCPACNSWLAQLAVHQGALKAEGVHIVAVFLATTDSLHNHFGDSLPFHILADEDGRVHQRYGLSTKFVRGSCLTADFLVNPDLRLEAAYYCTHNRNPAISDILSWGRVTHGKITGAILWSEGV